MSASLVGSEMCIRDSVRELAVGAVLVPHAHGPPPECGVRSIHVELAAGPVSYTHLTLPTICSV
eukprot:10548554-Alexandrium_andersonii.AAC.1